MKSAMSIAVSLAASFLLACGVGPEPTADTSAPASPESGDVTALAVCGDGICALAERTSCPQDCPPVCGDGVCCNGETQQSCPGDCNLGNKPYCYKSGLSASATESASR